MYTVSQEPTKDALGCVSVDGSLKIMCQVLRDPTAADELASVSGLLNSIDGLRAGAAAVARVMAGLDAFATMSRKAILSGIASKIDELAAVCEKRAPRWTHIVGDSDYKAALAKRQLLKSPARNILPDLSNRLYTLVADVEKDLTFVGIESAASADEVAESLANGSAVWEMCSMTISVIAATNILEEFGQCAAGKQMAVTFMGSPRPKGFPRILETRIKELAGK